MTLRERLLDHHHACDMCFKILLKKALFCKKCKKEYESWDEHKKMGWWSSDYDPIEWEERYGL